MSSIVNTISNVLSDIANHWTVAAASSCFGATVATLVLLAVYRRKVFTKSAGKKLKLYHFKVLRSSRCAWMVHELKAEKDIEFVEFNPYYALPNDTEKYKRYKDTVHPNATVPALQLPNGHVVKESGAICFLLAEHYGSLLPKRDWASYYDWGMYATVRIDATLGTLHGQLFDDSPNREVVSRAVADFRRSIGALDQHLKDRTFICGKEFTTADVIVGFSLMWASLFKGGVLVADYPAVHDYLQRLKKRKAFIRGMGTTNEWLAASEATEFNHKLFEKMKYEIE